MRHTAVAVGLFAAAALSCGPAVVAANPIAVEMMIDFDPPGYMHESCPAPYTQVNAYVTADFTGWIEGIKMVAFRLELTPGTAMGLNFTSSDPIIFIDGDWESGIVVSTDDCLDSFPAVLGYLSVFYLGVPGYITIHPHPELGNVFASCEDPGEMLEYCYVQDGGLCASAPAPRFLCQHNPVNDVTWGAIKALYR
jgi:hypothetical protein